MTVQFNKPSADETQFGIYNPIGIVGNNTSRMNKFYRTKGKSLMDFVLVLLSTPIVVPIIGIMALVVALNGGSPFYTQRRVGRNGTIFQMLKIRTMVHGADEVLEAYLASNPQARREWDHKQKLHNDPRITRIGKVLRATSFDELPQLWNVLRGDMSLVGPRPMMLEQKALYSGWAYYEIVPGITGNWQVSDRNMSSFAERAAFDDLYYRNISLEVDFRLLCRTIKVVAHGTGH